MYQNSMAAKEWCPEKVLNTDRLNAPYAVLVLNRKILLKPYAFLKLWNNAAVRVLIDGAANRWLKYVNNNYLNEQISPPDYLTGDMDSCSPLAQKALMKLGCQLCATKDQSETDFTKCLLTLLPIFQAKNILNVITVLDYSGRVDHILSQINTLHKAANFLNDTNLFLLTRNSLAWLLHPGQHTIQIPDRFVAEQYWCSYVPVGDRCCVTTNGLKWDLENIICEFGGIVSSSNTYSTTNVRIKCDKYLFWSMGTDSESSDEDDYE